MKESYFFSYIIREHNGVYDVLTMKYQFVESFMTRKEAESFVVGLWNWQNA